MTPALQLPSRWDQSEDSPSPLVPGMVLLLCTRLPPAPQQQRTVLRLSVTGALEPSQGGRPKGHSHGG